MQRRSPDDDDDGREPRGPMPGLVAACAIAAAVTMAVASCQRAGVDPYPHQEASRAALPAARDALTPAAFESSTRLPSWVLGGAPEAMPDKVKDAAIAAAVSSALARDASLHGHAIDVDSAGGRVVLQGLAPDGDARARATSIAARIDGVEAVENRLRLVPALR